MPAVTFDAVLFDLDGTLADTAPDLGAALNRLRDDEGLPPLPLETLRPHTSSGTRGMLRAGFGLTPANDGYAAMAARFLCHYERTLCVGTRLFPQLEPVLAKLEQRGIAWGVVTNKPQRFTEPLIDALGLTARCACIISGDSAPNPKPAPDTLLLASRRLDIAPTAIAYVGDDLRDVQAGQAAGMFTVAAGWGYLGVDAHIDTWGADRIAPAPTDLMTICQLD
jgi:phosphoglycolate phosphatase